MQSFTDPALEADMEDHLGYPKHEKAVRSDTGDLEISTPRDRDGDFGPILVRKHQSRISGHDDKIIFHYRHNIALRANVSQTLADSLSYAEETVEVNLVN